jgi:hypothetical protein
MSTIIVCRFLNSLPLWKLFRNFNFIKIKKYILSLAFGVVAFGFLSMNPTNKALAQEVELGHWVDVYWGSPVPIFQICAGGGSVCSHGDFRPPGEY